MSAKPKRMSIPEMVATAVFVFSIAGLAVLVLYSSTVLDVTAVTVILNRLPTAVETADVGRSVRRGGFGLRFLAAMVILGTGQAAWQPDPDASPVGLIPIVSTASHACSMKRLSGVVNQMLPTGMVYRFMRSQFP